jgi:GxxExxY protein
MIQEKLIYKDLTYKIIGLAMEVHNELGYGFLEKVYENAMKVQFSKSNIKADFQVQFKVNFKGEVIGEFYPDIIVDDKVILELKAVEKINDIHKAQILNYLKVTKLKLGLILNFSKEKLEYERIIL